jgi:hypothetical protein
MPLHFCRDRNSVVSVLLHCSLSVSRSDHSTICVYKRKVFSSSTSYLLHFTYHFLSWGWNKISPISPVTILICNIHVKRVFNSLLFPLTNHFRWNWLHFYHALCIVYHIYFEALSIQNHSQLNIHSLKRINLFSINSSLLHATQKNKLWSN